MDSRIVAFDDLIERNPLTRGWFLSAALLRVFSRIFPTSSWALEGKQRLFGGF